MLFRIRVVEKYRKQNYFLFTQFIILMLQMVLTWSTGYTVGTMSLCDYFMFVIYKRHLKL
jgi:hypothetical protein